MCIEFRVRFIDAESEPIDVWIERGATRNDDTLAFQSADNTRVAMSLDRQGAEELARVLHRFSEKSEIAT
jgi:hypothetical protein